VLGGIWEIAVCRASKAGVAGRAALPLYLANRGSPCSALDEVAASASPVHPARRTGSPEMPDRAGPQYVAFRSLT
jgi:hypothetical protein